MALRANNRVITLKLEGTPGIDSLPTAIPADVLDMGAFDRDSGINFIDIDELRAALDKAAPVRGVAQPTAAIRLQLKGSGSASTAPNVGRLLQIAGLLETIQTVIPATGTSLATAGTATTLTIDRSVATDWSATSGIYVGRIIELAGNPTTATRCIVTDYTVTGSNAVITVDRTFSPILSIATTAKLIPGVQYQPQSGVIPTASVYDWTDGTQTKLLGSMADLTLAARAGQPWELTGNLRSQFPVTPVADVALPVYIPSTTLRPPIWRNGGFAYGGKRAMAAAMSIALGNDLQNPPDPNASQGVGPTELVGRAVGGDITPLLVLAATRNALQDTLDQNLRALTAITDDSAAAGNRWAMCVTQAAFTGHRNTAENAFAAEAMTFRSNGTNAQSMSLFMF